MSSSIDSRIVAMKFDNSTFKTGVTSTLDLLSKLKTAVAGLPNQAKGLASISTEAKKVDLSNVQNQAHGVGNAFSAMAIVATTALATVAHSVTSAGIQMGKSLTVAPIAEGLTEYETNLNSIQTIMANTGLEGEKGLNKVQGALDELNHYSDKTIYNFSEMARNIGTFTAAGVDLQPATEAIKGIANLAAVSGSTSQQASTAMYQLSQALAAGKVTLMDWNSVVNAGMGGQVLKDALMETARVHGVAVDDIIKKSGSFRDSISEGWITGEILTETLQKFTGDLSEAQLRNMGYTEQQIEGIIKMGKVATDAATKVKTASQLINTLQETATSGWAKTWSLIFGDFFEARIMFTAANDVLGSMLSESARQRNQMFREWNKMGGRYAAIDALSNSFTALMNILRPIGQAWRDVFPAMTGERLYELTVMLRDFTESLIVGEDTMRAIRSIFGAVFGVLGVGVEIVKGILRYFITFIQLLAGGSGGAFELAGSLAEIVAQLTQWIIQGDYIANFFDKIIAGRAALLGPIIEGFGEILRVLAGWVGTGAEAAIEAIATALEFLAPYLPVIADALRAAGDAVENYLVSGFERLEPVLRAIKGAIEDALGALSGIGGNIGGAFGGLAGMFDIGDTADKAASGIDRVKDALGEAGRAASGGAQSGLAAFWEFLKGFGEFLGKVGGAILMGVGWLGKQLWAEIAGMFEGGAEHIGDIGQFISGIGSAIAGALSGISFGDVIVALNTALTAAIGGAFARTLWKIGSMFDSMHNMFGSVGGTLEQLQNNLKAMQNEVRSDIIMKIAISLGILAAAVYVLSTIDGEALGRSLAAIAAMLIMLSAALIVLEKAMPDATTLKSAVQFGAISFVLLGLGVALLAMALALRVISNLDGEELKKGLLTMGAVLAGIIATTAVLNKTGGAASLIQASIAIGILAFALTAFAAALKLYSALDTGMLVEGGLKIAAIVIGMGLAFRAFPAAGALAASAAMFVAANALVVMAGALKLLATMDAGDSWQSLLTLGGAMLILAIGANAMNTALMGAAAMLVLGAALALFVPSLLLLGGADISTLAIGITAMAVAFALFGAIGYVAGGGLLALGAGMLLLGAGLALVGAGMFAFGTGLSLMASSGVAAFAVLRSAIMDFLNSAPAMANSFKNASIAWAKAIGASAGAWAQAAGKIVREFLKQVIKTIPLIGKAFRALIKEGLKTIGMFVPDFIKLGFRILQEFMSGLMRNIGELTRKGVQIMVRFIDGIASQADKLVSAAGRLVVAFIKAIGRAIANQAGQVGSYMRGLAGDIVDGLVNGLSSLWSRVTGWLEAQVNKIPGPIRKALGISSPSKVMMEIGKYISLGLAIGIRKYTPQVEKDANALGDKTTEVLTMAMRGAQEALELDPNMHPTIAPVLDLTQMANEASKIGTLLDTQPLQANVSYSAATSLADEIGGPDGPDDGPEGGGDVIFEQHLHSPKALDSVTIYRTTRNQFSMAKEALKK